MAGSEERQRRHPVAEEQPVEDRPGADIGAHDARVPGEPARHNQADGGDDIAQQRDAAGGGEDRRGEGGDGEGDREIAAVERHHEGQRHGGGDAGGEGAEGEPVAAVLSAGAILPKRSARR